MDAFGFPVVPAEPHLHGWGRVTEVSRGDTLMIAMDRGKDDMVQMRVRIWGTSTTAPIQPLKADRRRVRVTECLDLFTLISGLPVDFTGVNTPGKAKSVIGCLLRITPAMVWFEGRGVDRYGHLLADVWSSHSLTKSIGTHRLCGERPLNKHSSMSTLWCPTPSPTAMVSECTDDDRIESGGDAGCPSSTVAPYEKLEILLDRFVGLHPNGITGVWNEKTVPTDAAI